MHINHIHIYVVVVYVDPLLRNCAARSHTRRVERRIFVQQHPMCFATRTCAVKMYDADDAATIQTYSLRDSIQWLIVCQLSAVRQPTMCNMCLHTVR